MGRICLLLFIFIAFVTQCWSQRNIQVVDDVKYTFDVEKVDAVNSETSDFGPVWNDYHIIFTSSREYDYLNVGENRWKNKSQYNLYSAEINPEDESIQPEKIEKLVFFDDQLNQYLHTGPACFSQTGDTLFFTQVIKTKVERKKVYRPQLFVAFKKKNGSFTNPEILNFVQKEYNYAHPTFDSKNKRLYFSSDRVGTYGGEDIFRVDWKEDGTWTEPMNLGDSVNTDGDEMFPHIFNGNELFFASNRKQSMGGLDLFWSYRGKDGWNKTRNLGNTVNSTKDDFSLTMHSNGKICFFASDRDGNDDIFYARVEREIVTKSLNPLKGQFVYRYLDENASGLDVQLISDDGIVLESTRTDSSGNFRFDKLGEDESYLVKVNGDTDDLVLKIYDKNGKKVAVLLSNEGTYTYKKLDHDEADLLSIIQPDSDEFDFEGQFLYEKLPGEFPNGMNVNVVDEDGVELFTTKTDEYGNFRFKKLQSDGKMYLTLDESQGDDLILLIYNNKGNVIAKLKRGEDEFFNYRRLRQSYENNLSLIKVDDQNFMEEPFLRITGEIDFKKLDGFFEGGLSIVAYNDDLEPLDTIQSDETGGFVFKKLGAENENLFFKFLDADDYDFDELFFYVTNKKNEKTAKLNRNENGFYSFRPLGNSDVVISKNNGEEDQITFVSENNTEQSHKNEVDNKNVKIDVSSTNSIFFDLNSSYLNAENKNTLNAMIDKLKSAQGNIEVNSYADSRANSDYNMWLSERRSKRVVDYLVSKGIAAKRIVSNAYGESKLFNDCGDGVECPEEMHKLNRRTEVVIQK